jgi:glycosyltransferase involved in cell wall biosynthesis
MKISTVIPVYNTKPKFFRECVNSVLNQTHPVDEIIIVDDGSDSPKTLDELYHSGLHLHPLIKIITQKNKRIPGALNTGIRYMTGDWFAGCSSDDRWLPHKIEEQVKFVRSNPKAKVMYSDWEYIDSEGFQLSTYTEPGFKDRFEAGRYIIKDYFGNWSGAMIHKSVFDDIGLYNENLIIHEDYEFNIRILTKYMMHRIPKVLFQYRTNPEAITFNKTHGRGTDTAKRCIEIGRAIAIEHFGNEEDRKKYPLWKFDE